MYTLFYTRYDPAKYLKLKKSYFDAAGFYHVDGFDKYVFSNTSPATSTKNSLYIFPPGKIPKDSAVYETIKLLNGNPVLTIYGNE
jgi:hypothetical protein